MTHHLRQLALILMATCTFAISEPRPTITEHLGAAERSAAAQAGMGIMAGGVTHHSALIQVRLTKTDKLIDGDVPGIEGVVEFQLRQADPSGPEKPLIQRVRATADRDFIARAAFDNLKSATGYRCTTRIGTNLNGLRPGPLAQFKTLPGPESADAARFVVVTGMNYAKFHGDDRIDRKRHVIENNTELPKPYAGPDKHLGYPALASILAKRPDFFVGTGDNVYYDTPKQPRAKTVPELRQKWHEQFVQPRYRDLFAAVPTQWMIDDHDYRVDDGDNTGDYAPSPQTGRWMMLQQLPVAADNDEKAKTYRTLRVNRNLQIWFTENRMYRSPNKTADGAGKTIWGTAQKTWLMRTLRDSDATFKLLISPTPMIGPDDLRKTDNHTNVDGFRHERDEFFRWLKQTGIDKQNFYILCGDRHWQYHAVHPSGIEEFSCGALVDANSRLGRKPGDPQSTDAQGLIKQLYYQTPRSGGFLMVSVGDGSNHQRPQLTFDFHDEKGKRLYRHIKRPVTP